MCFKPVKNKFLARLNIKFIQVFKPDKLLASLMSKIKSEHMFRKPKNKNLSKLCHKMATKQKSHSRMEVLRAD